MSERGKPFVAWVTERAIADMGRQTALSAHWMHHHEVGRYDQPVVVTPLLPDDPRPGETWASEAGDPCKITTAPYVDHRDERRVGVFWTESGVTGTPLVSRLRRPPVLKTYRLKVTPDDGFAGHAVFSYSVEAESREAALAKLSDALEEVD